MNDDSTPPLPGLPPDANRITVAIYLPLPQPIPLSDGSVLTAPYMEGHDSPIVTRYWQVPDHGFSFAASIVAMRRAAERSHQIEARHATDHSEVPQLATVDGIQTIVEAVVTVPASPQDAPQDVLERALSQSLDALDRIIRSIRVTTMNPMEVPTRQSLPSLVLVLAIDPEKDQDSQVQLPSPWFLEGAKPPAGIQDELNDEELDEAQYRSALHSAGSRAHTFRDSAVEARTALQIRGDTSSAVVWANLAVEAFLDQVLALLVWEEGTRPRQAAPVFEFGLRSRVKRQYHQRLGGNWTFDTGPMAVWGGSGGLAELRGRVVHAGYRPSSEEARNAIQSIFKIQDFVSRRIRENRNDYPRTTMQMVGRQTLESEGLMVGSYAAIIDEIADAEPSWAREVTQWHTYVDRVLINDGGLTGAEQACLRIDQMGNMSWWVWDGEDGSINPSASPPVLSPDLDAVSALDVNWPPNEGILIPIPGLSVELANPSEFMRSSEFGLEEPFDSPILSNLHDSLRSLELDGSTLTALFLVSLAEQLGRTGSSEEGRVALEAGFEMSSSFNDPGFRGPLMLAVGRCGGTLNLTSAVCLPALDIAAEDFIALEELSSAAVAYIDAGMTAYAGGNLTNAQSRLEKSLEISESWSYWILEGKAAGNLGTVLGDLGEFERAGAMFGRSLHLFELAGDTEGLARSTASHARWCSLQGNAVGARNSYIDAARLFSDAYETPESVPARAGVAAMALSEGFVEAASLILMRTSGSVRAGATLGIGGSFVRSVGEYSTGYNDVLLSSLVRTLEWKQYDVLAADLLLALSEEIIEDGNVETASVLTQWALEFCRRSSWRRGEAQALEQSALLALTQEDYSRALVCTTEQYEASEGFAWPVERAAVAANCSAIAVGAGDSHQAREWVRTGERVDINDELRGWLTALEGLCLDAEELRDEAKEKWRNALQSLEAAPRLYSKVQDWISGSKRSKSDRTVFLHLWASKSGDRE